MSKNFSNSLSYPKEDKLLISHLKEFSDRSYYSGRATFSDFLDTREQSIAEGCVGQYGVFYGGYEDAERRMVGFGVEGENEFPITPISITVSDGASDLEHRSVLGSIMGLGIERSVMGDILICDKKRAVVFIKSDFYNYFKSNLLKVGKDNCQISIATEQDLDIEMKTVLYSASIASLRLDCIVAAAIKTSREKAVEIIKARKTLLNRRECDDASKIVSEGDQIVVRGYGKYYLKGVTGTTRKGRIAIQLEKYI